MSRTTLSIVTVRAEWGQDFNQPLWWEGEFCRLDGFRLLQTILEQRMSTQKYIRRREAAKYLTDTYGYGTLSTLERLASEGGGPDIFYAGTNVPLYTTEALDEWMQSKIRRVKRVSELSENADGESK